MKNCTLAGSVATAGAIYYHAWAGGGIAYFFLGSLIVLHAFWLYRLNEQRLEEVRRAQAEKLQHLQEIAALHLNTIESLAIAIDAKDQTTHGHVRRTQVYAMELGKLLEVTPTELEALRAGALLHDIGKLAVPEYILNKPGKLTAAEFEKMKIHTVVGGDIVRRVNFPYPVEDIVRYHHEKWDGGGYPRGLKGEQIPLVARVISVVDFYDATRCDRPYRMGMKREESIGLLRRMAGKSFDPRVVETFVENIDYFDSLIAKQDRQEQVPSAPPAGMSASSPDAGLALDHVAASNGDAGFRSIAEAQREVFALHEIAQTIGGSLNLQDTSTLVASKLRAIVPFDTCVIFMIDEKTGKAQAVHAAGEHAEAFARRSFSIGDGITGWVIANSRSMCNTSPELDLAGVPAEVSAKIRGVLVAPLTREEGSFGAITLYSDKLSSYTAEHVRLLESVAHHASNALNNALMYERTKESALSDALTGLPNSRALHSLLEQRLAECRRQQGVALSVLTINIDDFKEVNNTYGHGAGDRVLAGAAEIIKRQVRQMDVLTRFAGDEFVAVMPTAAGDVAVRVAERIRAAVEAEKFSVRTGRSIRLGVSIGVGNFPSDGETSDDLLMAADRNMHRDKSARKINPELSKAVGLASLDAFR